MSVTAGAARRWGISYLQGCHIDSARLDAEVLLAHVLGLDRTALYRDGAQVLTPDDHQRFARLIGRRGAHEPVAYLTGMREFWSLPISVRPGVLIPRPDTEWVIETALRYAGPVVQQRGRCRILDIGTGSGNIAIAMATSLVDAVVTAIDIAWGALSVAQHNARSCGVAQRVTLLQSDGFAALHPRRACFDMLLSNPPYIAAGELSSLPDTVRCFEPHLALHGGADGLTFYRRFSAEGPLYLAVGGVMIVEVGYQQAAEVARLYTQSLQWDVLEVVKDYSGIERVVVAQHRQKGAARHGLHRDRGWGSA
jgi:release factor glutamine methyltransferase